MMFENKIVVITGGSNGIGAAAVDKFKADGAIVFNLDLVKGTSEANFIECDVSDYSLVKKSISKVVEAAGRIDILFSNAGIHKFGTIEETSVEEFKKVLDINLFGTFYLLKEVLPIMKKNGSGKICLMGSDQALVGKGVSSAYGASKGAIGQLTKSTAIDYAPFGINVNCICPGTIDTPLYHNAIQAFSESSGITKEELYEAIKSAQPITRVGKPDEVADLVCYLCSEKSNFTTGALFQVDGGYCAQ